MSKIAFTGPDSIGQPMPGHLLNAGYEATAFSLDHTT